MSLKRPVGIAAKASEPLAISLTEQLLDWLAKNQIDFRLDEILQPYLASRSLPSEQFVPRNRLTAAADPVVVLGGDGTLISVSRYAADPPATIVGVNIGTLGFLTEITVDEIFSVLGAVFEKRVNIESCALLRTTVNRQNRFIREFLAINDVVITKNALARLFDIQLLVDNQSASMITGDGVIVSTPIGSTAYSLSAGGSIVHPRVQAILVTPICPHSLTSRPLVLPDTSQLTLRLTPKRSERDDEIFLTIDGQEGMALQAGDTVTIGTSEHSVHLVRSPSKSYFEVLGSKLKWGTH